MRPRPRNVFALMTRKALRATEDVLGVTLAGATALCRDPCFGWLPRGDAGRFRLGTEDAVEDCFRRVLVRPKFLLRRSVSFSRSAGRSGLVTPGSLVPPVSFSMAMRSGNRQYGAAAYG